ncbi:relaxase/mobilization nuclease domain-containing protein [Bacteroides fragilis]|nr:relaxase/mobilization nuclease domain-containing protein [Bacteroides fragilis]
MGLANHQYIIIRHSGTERDKEQAHLHILANRVSLSGELYRDNWIGKKATEAANAIAKERNLVQSQGHWQSQQSGNQRKPWTAY